VRGLALAVFVPLVILAGCGGEKGPRVVIATAEGERTVEVEIADTEGERARGLMGRESLDADAGMVFVFPAETSGAFWMKNTLIPLSIAFYDENGRILRILDMEPCRRDPCPLYDPGVSYRGALEVNRGAFRDWGVGEGDTLTLEH
jgi:uncharacterized protein